MEDTIQRRKLADEVLDRLLKMIESGELLPGHQLPSERELMSRYKVGRPAVREAMQALERMGMIEISHGERARMVAVEPRTLFQMVHRSARHLLQTSPQTLENLREARVMFEMAMTRLAAGRATHDHIKRLNDALARQRAAIGDASRFVAADIAFHTEIAKISGNPIYEAVSSAMLHWIFDFHAGLLRVPGAEQLTLNEHDRIIERIAARDEEGAAKSMSDHLLRVSATYHELLTKQVS